MNLLKLFNLMSKMRNNFNIDYDDGEHLRVYKEFEGELFHIDIYDQAKHFNRIEDQTEITATIDCYTSNWDGSYSYHYNLDEFEQVIDDELKQGE